MIAGLLLAGASLAAGAVEVTHGLGAQQACAVDASAPYSPAAMQPSLLPGSEIASGQRDISQAWLASATRRYGHAALGSNLHAASVHAMLRDARDPVSLVLPEDRVFEDRIPRLFDLDGDGRDELVVVEAHASHGGSLVVYRIEGSGAAAHWVERARSEPVGAMRWLNPVGAADFDGDGRLELASVGTPHIGGVLTLYRYQPPRLEVLGRVGGVSNHRYGSPEQRVSALLPTASGPITVVPDASFSRLMFHRWERTDGWRTAFPALVLPAEAVRIFPQGDAVCVELAGGAWWRLTQR